jgi:hypothetical protein
MKLTLPKWGLGSPLRLSKLQNSIARVKTICIGVFFISLESYQSVDVKIGLTWAIWTSAAHVMAKRRVRSQIGNLTSDLKSQESTRPLCVHVECDTSLKSSRRELKVCFRPHLNRRFKQRNMTLQSFDNPNRDSFRTPPWESRDKKSFGCGCYGEVQRILYGGRWWLPPSPGRGESCESRVIRCLS